MKPPNFLTHYISNTSTQSSQWRPEFTIDETPIPDEFASTRNLEMQAIMKEFNDFGPVALLPENKPLKKYLIFILLLVSLAMAFFYIYNLVEDFISNSKSVEPATQPPSPRDFAELAATNCTNGDFSSSRIFYCSDPIFRCVDSQVISQPKIKCADPNTVICNCTPQEFTTILCTPLRSTCEPLLP